MRAELPFLAAGTVALAGGIAREKSFPANGVTAVVATVALVVIASATDSTRLAPVVRAIGLLLLMATVFSAVPALTAKKGKTNG